MIQIKQQHWYIYQLVKRKKKEKRKRITAGLPILDIQTSHHIGSSTPYCVMKIPNNNNNFI
jgi:hypothetical protein